MLAIWLIPSLVSEALTDATPLRHAALFSTGKRVRPWMRAGLGEILGELLRRLNGFSCPLSGKGNDSRRLERRGRGWGARARGGGQPPRCRTPEEPARWPGVQEGQSSGWRTDVWRKPPQLRSHLRPPDGRRGTTISRFERANLETPAV